MIISQIVTDMVEDIITTKQEVIIFGLLIDIFLKLTWSILKFKAKHILTVNIWKWRILPSNMKYYACLRLAYLHLIFAQSKGQDQAYFPQKW